MENYEFEIEISGLEDFDVEPIQRPTELDDFNFND